MSRFFYLKKPNGEEKVKVELEAPTLKVIDHLSILAKDDEKQPVNSNKLFLEIFQMLYKDCDLGREIAKKNFYKPQLIETVGKVIADFNADKSLKMTGVELSEDGDFFSVFVDEKEFKFEFPDFEKILFTDLAQSPFMTLYKSMILVEGDKEIYKNDVKYQIIILGEIIKMMGEARNSMLEDVVKK